jgi:glycosyltransferase involved in cell wall biosynthesis
MLTVTFATRDRARSLPRVLSAFAALQPPPGDWALIIVDNGSRDGTASVVHGFADRIPVTLLQCPDPGKNRALNCALPLVRGDLVVFTDDDVLPAPDWLLALRRAADAHPEATLFGGTISMEWPAPPPRWLSEEAVQFTVLYSKKEIPSGPCSILDIFGCNMAIRSAVFAAGARFAEHVGPDATKPLYTMGSETELLRRLHDQGHAGWFAAEARVAHIIRPEQLEERWILDRAYRFGFSIGPLVAPRLFGVRRIAYRVAAKASLLLPASPTRLRLRYRDRVLAGIADGGALSPNRPLA